MTQPRCLDPGSPTCVLPTIGVDTKHTCTVCKREWHKVKNKHGSYWQHTPKR